jgi:hypothetical protein
MLVGNAEGQKPRASFKRKWKTTPTKKINRKQIGLSVRNRFCWLRIDPMANFSEGNIKMGAY